MTSLRRRLERLGKLDSLSEDYFYKHYGQIPLCCMVYRQDGKMKCDFAKDFMTEEEFHEFCLKCQDEILRRITTPNNPKLKKLLKDSVPVSSSD